MRNVIMLSGKQGSGKTSTQKLLGERLQAFGKKVEYVNFADILYEMHNAVLDVLHFYWPKRDIVKDGPLLQMLGTNWGRKTIDENIWVKCLQKKISYFSKDRIVIVGDCRFPNEFDGFPEALRVRLECPEEIRKARCSMWREDTNHPSEVALDEYAASHKFDILLNTAEVPVEACVAAILDALSLSDEDFRAKLRFESVAQAFNSSLRLAEDASGYGANFHWIYSPDGKKSIKLTDCAKSTPPSQEKIDWARASLPEIIDKATKELVKDESGQPR